VEASGELAAGDSSARTNGTLICHEFTPANSFMEPARTRGRYQHRVSNFNAGRDGDHYCTGYMVRVHSSQFHFHLSRALGTPVSQPLWHHHQITHGPLIELLHWLASLAATPCLGSGAPPDAERHGKRPNPGGNDRRCSKKPWLSQPGGGEGGVGQ
jgi:hypothetical protein